MRWLLLFPSTTTHSTIHRTTVIHTVLPPFVGASYTSHHTGIRTRLIQAFKTTSWSGSPDLCSTLLVENGSQLQRKKTRFRVQRNLASYQPKAYWTSELALSKEIHIWIIIINTVAKIDPTSYALTKHHTRRDNVNEDLDIVPDLVETAIHDSPQNKYPYTKVQDITIIIKPLKSWKSFPQFPHLGNRVVQHQLGHLHMYHGHVPQASCCWDIKSNKTKIGRFREKCDNTVLFSKV